MRKFKVKVEIGDYIRVADGEFWMEGFVEKKEYLGDEEAAYIKALISSSEFVKNTSGNIVLYTDTITHLNVELENE